jgi:hypothetical protein
MPKQSLCQSALLKPKGTCGISMGHSLRGWISRTAWYIPILAKFREFALRGITHL